MKNYFYILTLLFLGTTAIAQKTLDQTLKKHNKNEVPYISVSELRMHQANNNVIILDSRELNEYQVSHIEGSTLVGYDKFSMDSISELVENKDNLIVVYCTLGIRSEVVADKLLKAGYSNVKNLYGGICEWSNKDFKVIDSTQATTKNIHTFSKEWSKWLLNGNPIY